MKKRGIKRFLRQVLTRVFGLMYMKVPTKVALSQSLAKAPIGVLMRVFTKVSTQGCGWVLFCPTFLSVRISYIFVLYDLLKAD